MARVLIVGGGCRGRELAARLSADGHALRISTRSEAGRAAIEELGAECWVGDPNRLATMRGALDRVTILCWLLATARAEPDELEELHGRRLSFFIHQAIDTTVRGLLIELPGAPHRELSEQAARSLSSLNAIPCRLLEAPDQDGGAWLEQAGAAIGEMLAGGGSRQVPGSQA